MNVEEYIKSECDRQHVTNYNDFRAAYEYATICPSPINMSNRSFDRFVQTLAHFVEPEINMWINPESGTYTNLRRSEVGFLHGTTDAVRAINVPSAFERWLYLCEQELIGNEDELIKALLDIHPWADGNGRTASILRNWALRKLDDPDPLPYYYGENV